ncbi:unnamed protein product [Rhizopus stolonifer]
MTTVDVSVITVDGRVLVGVLKGTDQAANVILENAKSVFFPMKEQNRSSRCTIGEVDKDKEQEMDITQLKADPLTHTIL